MNVREEKTDGLHINPDKQSLMSLNCIYVHALEFVLWLYFMYFSFFKLMRNCFSGPFWTFWMTKETPYSVYSTIKLKSTFIVHHMFKGKVHQVHLAIALRLIGKLKKVLPAMIFSHINTDLWKIHTFNISDGGLNPHRLCTNVLSQENKAPNIRTSCTTRIFAKCETFLVQNSIISYNL